MAREIHITTDDALFVDYRVERVTDRLQWIASPSLPNFVAKTTANQANFIFPLARTTLVAGVSADYDADLGGLPAGVYQWHAWKRLPGGPALADDNETNPRKWQSEDFVWNGVAAVPPTPPPGTPVSPLHTYDEFTNRFGLKNVTTAANRDGQPSSVVNSPTIQQAFTYAAEWLSARLQNRYKYPIDFIPNTGQVPARVKEWAMVLAYENLQNARPRNPDDTTEKDFFDLAHRIKDEIRCVAMGVPGYDIPAVKTTGSPAAGTAALLMQGNAVSGWIQSRNAYRPPVWEWSYAGWLVAGMSY